jgi:hypothetical protein
MNDNYSSTTDKDGKTDERMMATAICPKLPQDYGKNEEDGLNDRQKPRGKQLGKSRRQGGAVAAIVHPPCKPIAGRCWSSWDDRLGLL